MTKRINLWSGPRNISTAIMYSFAQRPDTKVEDEPLYAYYLKNSEARSYHPGAEDILNSMDADADKVLSRIKNDHSAEVFFYKNMTHHLLTMDDAFFEGFHQVILTRDPVEMLPSFAAVIENPTIDDVGYQRHTELIEKLQRDSTPFVVIEAESFLNNPEEKLRKLCEAIDIPFYPEMLFWSAGARPEDGVWAPYWYTNVHKSTGFMPFKKKTEPFPEHLKPLLGECMRHYLKLKAMAL
ncbi:sulfotransferase-like domain-containing protein [Jiulongibacter sediminis]|uniref:Aminotransferase class IV n=1 Tax=Jiulongibacter sediminis TaxID=1605367 RepID=A0A0P7BZB9_9BACT|nr:sulfotransferase family protein [Jiulongibacter sediminis]KPM47565.1 aminotransferase class IV [Jiulongibacter sediminis]TBX23359.1 aminotransferase class IV [Jiulongibacter sediminis]